MWFVALFVLTGVNKIVVNDSRATSLMLSGLCSRVHLSSALAPSIASIPWEMGTCLKACDTADHAIMIRLARCVVCVFVCFCFVLFVPELAISPYKHLT